MSHDTPNSAVEISIGSNELRIEGSEDFIAQELEVILNQIDLTHPQKPSETPKPEEAANQEEPQVEEQVALEEVSSVNDRSVEETDEERPLEKVSEKLNVPVHALEQYFYVETDDDNGYNIHIQDPTSIPKKQALLGYCTIREVLSGDFYHNNQEMKERLIDIEKIDITNWGGTFLYRLREEGLIKDDPNTDKKRNKPFKITPSGRQAFIEWLESRA